MFVIATKERTTRSIASRITHHSFVHACSGGAAKINGKLEGFINRNEKTLLNIHSAAPILNIQRQSFTHLAGGALPLVAPGADTAAAAAAPPTPPPP